MTQVDEPRTDDTLAVTHILLPSNRVPRGEDPHGNDNVLGIGDAAVPGSLIVQIAVDGFGGLMNLRVGPAGLTEST